MFVAVSRVYIDFLVFCKFLHKAGNRRVGGGGAHLIDRLHYLDNLNHSH